jgi:hypothetical protein
MSFPKELNLGSNKPISAFGKPSINRYRSDNSTYNNNDTIRIEIPTGRNGQYLFPRDSFIEGSVKINASNGATASSIYIDQSVYALFNRIRVIHGSTTLEDCLYVNRVWTSVMDVQVNDSERRGLGITHLIGDTVNAKPGYNSGQFGAALMNCTVSQSAIDSSYSDFAFPLPSAIFGTLSSKALPIGLCGASSLYIELELASPNVAFVGEMIVATPSTASIVSFTVQNIFYNTKITTLPSDVNNALLETTGGIINLPAVAYKAEQKTFCATSGAVAFNDKFSFQYSSIKSFYFFVMNTAATAGDIKYRSVSARPRANITDYYLSINGEAYPSQTIAAGLGNAYGAARMYAELLRSWDQLSDTNAGGILNYMNYTQSNAHTAPLAQLTSAANQDYGINTLQQRFIAGIDLDRFNHSGDTLMSGTDTMGQLITLFVNSAASTDPLTLYAYIMYDVMYNIEYGQITART